MVHGSVYEDKSSNKHSTSHDGHELLSSLNRRAQRRPNAVLDPYAMFHRVSGLVQQVLRAHAKDPL